MNHCSPTFHRNFTMTHPSTLQSLIAGRWIGSRPGAALHSAVNGRAVFHTHADALDFGEALAFARGSGLPALMAMRAVGASPGSASWITAPTCCAGTPKRSM